MTAATASASLKLPNASRLATPIGFRQPPPRHQRRRRHDIRRQLVRPLAERQRCRRQDLRRLQPTEQAGQVGLRQRHRLEQPGGHIQPRRADAKLAILRQRQQQIDPPGLQQRLLGDRAGRDQAHHLAADRRLGVASPRARLGVLHLFGHRDAEAAADQPREIRLGRMLRHAAHRHRRAVVLTPLGQRDVQRSSRGFGIREEQLVEIPHAKEHQRIGVRCLGGEPLRHGRRGAGGIQRAGGGSHRSGLPRAAAIAKADARLRDSSAPKFHPTISLPRRMLTIGWQKRIPDREAGNE